MRSLGSRGKIISLVSLSVPCTAPSTLLQEEENITKVLFKPKSRRLEHVQNRSSFTKLNATV